MHLDFAWWFLRLEQVEDLLSLSKLHSLPVCCFSQLQVEASLAYNALVSQIAGAILHLFCTFSRRRIVALNEDAVDNETDLKTQSCVYALFYSSKCFSTAHMYDFMMQRRIVYHRYIMLAYAYIYAWFRLASCSATDSCSFAHRKPAFYVGIKLYVFSLIHRLSVYPFRCFFGPVFFCCTVHIIRRFPPPTFLALAFLKIRHWWNILLNIYLWQINSVITINVWNMRCIPHLK